ncbi:hypothetical protein MNBD_GAMMA13-1848, partial [hydrothermal vent metagenome]
MNISRREFIQMLAAASASGMSLSACESDKSAAPSSGVKPVTKPSTP